MKSIYIIILALVACACSLEGNTAQEASEEMVKLRLCAVNIPQTKTLLNDDLSVSWHQGDEIFVVAGNFPEGAKFTNVEQDGETAVFEGEVPKSVLSNTTYETALYSYKSDEWSAAEGRRLEMVDRGQGVTGVVLPKEQPLVPGSFARDYNLSMAAFELNDQLVVPMYFQNICGLLRVSLKGNADIRSIAITAPGVVNGLFKGSYDTYEAEDTKYALTVNGEINSNTVTLVSEEAGLSLTSDAQKFYACVLPEDISIGGLKNRGPGAGEYTIVVTTVEGKVVRKTLMLEEGVSASMVSDLGEMEVNYTYEDAAGTIFDIEPTGSAVTLKYLGEKPVVTEKPDWLEVVTGDGKITFSAGLYLGCLARSGDVNLIVGDKSVSIGFRQTPVPGFEKGSIVFAPEGGSQDIAKTEFLPEEYAVDDSACDWITATVTETGVAVTVTANDTGFRRVGYIDVKVGDTIVAVIEVCQMPIYKYSSFIGEYSISYRDMGGNRKENLKFVINPAVAEGEAGFGEKYIATFTSDVFNYPIELVFNSDSQTAPISLVCPQAIPEQGAHPNIHFMWVHVAKKPTSANFVVKKDFGAGTGDYKEIDVTDEGVGYDLTVDDSDGNVNLIFMPNAKAWELYNGNLDGFWIPGNRYNDTEGEYDIIRDWLRPLAGEEYLKMSKN